jgi:hypothetical protein
VGNQRLTAWATARPNINTNFNLKWTSEIGTSKTFLATSVFQIWRQELTL